MVIYRVNMETKSTRVMKLLKRKQAQIFYTQGKRICRSEAPGSRVVRDVVKNTEFWDFKDCEFYLKDDQSTECPIALAIKKKTITE